MVPVYRRGSDRILVHMSVICSQLSGIVDIQSLPSGLSRFSCFDVKELVFVSDRH
jgi:hypothetical protein